MSNVIDDLIPYFEEDKRYILLVGDMGFGAIDGLKGAFSDRVINCGIMEQSMVGISAGMALDGLKPIVYSIINFLCFRALEQIRNDIVLQGLNVKFIGKGKDDYFKFLGKSHYCGIDDIKIFNIIGLPVYDNFNQWIEDEKAGYIRI